MTGRTTVGDAEYSLGALNDSLGFLTRVIHIQINDRVRSSGGLGLSPATLSLLQLLQANPDIRQAHAARILQIHESNMANLIKGLIAQGLIERRREPPARGGLWITEAGERELARCSSAAHLDRVHASALSEAEYRQLVSLLNRVYRASLA